MCVREAATAHVSTRARIGRTGRGAGHCSAARTIGLAVRLELTVPLLAFARRSMTRDETLASGTPGRGRNTLRFEVVQREDTASGTQFVKRPWIGSEYQCSFRVAMDCSGVLGRDGSCAGSCGRAVLPNGRGEKPPRRLSALGRTLTVGESHSGSCLGSGGVDGRASRTGSFQPLLMVETLSSGFRRAGEYWRGFLRNASRPPEGKM